MSRTYEIACHDCKTALWIGQGWTPGTHLYATPEHLKLLHDFLFAHIGHRLEFNNDEKFAVHDYTEWTSP